MTITIQRWLSVRLDFFANLLILGIALFAAGLRHSINPAKVGVVLSYTLNSKYFSFCGREIILTVLSVTQVFGMLQSCPGITPRFMVKNTADSIAHFALNEQNMNAVERVLHFSQLPSEADDETPDDPPASWPEQGQINFHHVEFAYREGLPLVLKDVNLDVHPGEKVSPASFHVLCFHGLAIR